MRTILWLPCNSEIWQLPLQLTPIAEAATIQLGGNLQPRLPLVAATLAHALSQLFAPLNVSISHFATRKHCAARIQRCTLGRAVLAPFFWVGTCESSHRRCKNGTGGIQSKYDLANNRGLVKLCLKAVGNGSSCSRRRRTRHTQVRHVLVFVLAPLVAAVIYRHYCDAMGIGQNLATATHPFLT